MFRQYRLQDFRLRLVVLVYAITILGILIGLPAGYGELSSLLTALASEYEMRAVCGSLTWSVSIVLTLGVSLLVSWCVARKNRKIDMVEALKGIE